MSRAPNNAAVHTLSQPVACTKHGDAITRVMSELERVSRDNVPQQDHIVEQLKQCPEAFQVGEMVAKILDAKKHNPDQTTHGDGCLPPAGTVVPPLV